MKPWCAVWRYPEQCPGMFTSTHCQNNSNYIRDSSYRSSNFTSTYTAVSSVCVFYSTPHEHTHTQRERERGKTNRSAVERIKTEHSEASSDEGPVQLYFFRRWWKNTVCVCVCVYNWVQLPYFCGKNMAKQTFIIHAYSFSLFLSFSLSMNLIQFKETSSASIALAHTYIHCLSTQSVVFWWWCYRCNLWVVDVKIIAPLCTR